MRKFLLISISFLVFGYTAYGQQCEPGNVCVKQTTIDAATKAAVELAEARDVIARFQTERAATTVERESAARLIDRLNSVISIQDRLVADYENVVKLYKETLQMYADLVERLQKRIDAPKSPFQKLLGALRQIATFAAGVALGRGF